MAGRCSTSSSIVDDDQSASCQLAYILWYIHTVGGAGGIGRDCKLRSRYRSTTVPRRSGVGVQQVQVRKLSAIYYTINSVPVAISTSQRTLRRAEVTFQGSWDVLDVFDIQDTNASHLPFSGL